MTEPPETPSAETPPKPASAGVPDQTAKSQRATRLAKALRDNLKRRKAPRPARPKDS